MSTFAQGKREKSFFAAFLHLLLRCVQMGKVAEEERERPELKSQDRSRPHTLVYWVEQQQLAAMCSMWKRRKEREH